LDAISAGCRAYETKPIVLRRLVARIEEMLHAETAADSPP
jgi:DNA-binding response OmpR family regulator